MQVVAPSMWYLMLIAQFYVVFPVLRWLLHRTGPAAFLAVCFAIAVGTRALAFTYAPFGAFDANATVLYALPCRLLSPALGMLAAGAVARAPVQPRPGLLAAVAAPACLLAVIAGWLGAYANQPGTTVALIGPALPMLLALPGLWVVCATAAATPVLAPTLTWAGQKALSLLVAQDFLRLVVGTLVACGVGVRELTWPLLPGLRGGGAGGDEGMGPAAGVVRVEVVASQPRQPAGGRGRNSRRLGSTTAPVSYLARASGHREITSLFPHVQVGAPTCRRRGPTLRRPQLPPAEHPVHDHGCPDDGNGAAYSQTDCRLERSDADDETDRDADAHEHDSGAPEPARGSRQRRCGRVDGARDGHVGGAGEELRRRDQSLLDHREPFLVRELA
jgi:hypothetical protein